MIEKTRSSSISHTQTLLSSTSTADNKDISTEIKFLAHCWLNDFEKEIFDGKTIEDLLRAENYE